MNSISRMTIVLATGFLLLGCSDESSKNSEEIVASATVSAERRSEGQVREIPTPADRKADLNRMMTVQREIDSKYPAIKPTARDPRFSVTSVSASGVVELDDGTRLSFEGMACDEQGISYLSRWVLSSEASVTYQPTAEVSENPIPALLWEVEVVDILNETTFSYTSLNEIALTSGWCDFKPAETNPLNDRFRELASRYKELR